MKIAFWGEEGHCGTTSNMLAVAAMASRCFPNAQISVKRLGATQETDGKKRAIIRQDNVDFYFLDCGSGFDGEKQQVLRQMDLVVVNLTQEEDCIERFFIRDRYKLSKHIVLVSDYYGQPQELRRQLEHRYRIPPEQVGIISHNGAFEYAVEKRKIRNFVQKQYVTPEDVRNEQLLLELKELLTCIRR